MSKTAKKYLVVEFLEKGKKFSAIIPDNWLHGTKCCLWPPSEDWGKIDSMARRSEVPDETWEAYPIHKMLYQTDNWEKALEKRREFKKFEDVLVTSSEEGRRKRRRLMPVIDSESEDEVLSSGDPEPYIPTPPRPCSALVSKAPIRKSNSVLTSQASAAKSARSYSRPSQGIGITVPGIETSRQSPILLGDEDPVPINSAALASIRKSSSATSQARAAYSARTYSGPSQGIGITGPGIETSRQSRILLGDEDPVPINSAALAKVITLLEEVKEEQRSQRRLIVSIKHAVKRTAEDEEPFDASVFPMMTDQAFQAENQKCQDKNYFKKMQQYLSCMGGESGEDMLKRMLRRLIGNDVAKAYSLQGKNKKSALDQLILYRVICRCFGARHQLALLSFLGFCIIYALRVNLSVAMVAMVNQTAVAQLSNQQSSIDCMNEVHSNETMKDVLEGEFTWTPKTQGAILSAFFYGYILTQILGGWLSQRFGGKIILGLGILCTSSLTLLTPLAARAGTGVLIALRVVEGLGEGMTFPAMHAMWSKWAPPLERSKLGTFSFSGMNIGTFAAMPLTGLLCQYGFAGGWPSVFYVFGGLGCLWFVFWQLLIYDSPDKHPFISTVEKKYIKMAIGDDRPLQHRHLPIRAWLKSPPIYALIVAHTCNNWGYITLLMDMPTYMKVVQGFDIKKNSVLSAIPYAVYWLVAILGGQAADYLRFWGIASTTDVRKLFTLLSLWLPALALWSIYWAGCDHVTATILLLIAIGTNGLHPSGTLVNHLDIGPNYAGMLLGITNTFANVPGMLAPTIVGILTNERQTRHQWQIVFNTTAIISVFGAVVFYCFGSGERQEWDTIDTHSICSEDSSDFVSDEKNIRSKLIPAEDKS